AGRRPEQVEPPGPIDVEAAGVALVAPADAGVELGVEHPANFAVEADAVERPVLGKHVKRLRLLADAEVPRPAAAPLRPTRDGVGAELLALGAEPDDAVAGVVEAVEVAGSAGLDVGRGRPADGVVVEEL